LFQGVEDVLKSESILSLQSLGEKLKSDCPEDVQLQIDTNVNNLVGEWKALEERLTGLQNVYLRADTIWTEINIEKNEIEEWIRTVCPHVELGKPSANIVSMLKDQFPVYEKKLEDVKGLAENLSGTLASSKPKKLSEEEEDRPTPAVDETKQLPLNLELEILSRKLTFLKTYLTSVQTLLEGSPERRQLVEEARLTLTSASKVRVHAIYMDIL